MASKVKGDGRTTRWDAHRDQRRAELVQAAVRAIDQHGPDVTIADIAAEAGVSKPVLYRYFTDKDQLHAAVGQWGADEVLARMLPPLRRTHPCGSGSTMRRRLPRDPRGAPPGLPAAGAPPRVRPPRRRQGRDRRGLRALPRRHAARARHRRRGRGALGARPGRPRALHRRVVARRRTMCRAAVADTSPRSSGTRSTARPPTSAYPSRPSTAPAPHPLLRRRPRSGGGRSRDPRAGRLRRPGRAPRRRGRSRSRPPARRVPADRRPRPLVRPARGLEEVDALGSGRTVTLRTEHGEATADSRTSTPGAGSGSRRTRSPPF